MVAVTSVLVPLLIWMGDESAGRSRWARVARTTETVTLGRGAFRGSVAQIERVEVLRKRAPWWVRGIALTCYLPGGAAVLAALPWVVGVLWASEAQRHRGLERDANLLLVIVYPFGCWAAARMWSLGRALLSGSAEGFREALARAAIVEVPLNVFIALGAVGIALSHRHVDGLLLAVAPIVTLSQLAGVSIAGSTQLRDDDPAEAAAPAAGPEVAASQYN